MCCRISVQPLDPVIARAVLAVGLFISSDEQQNHWTRILEEEGTVVSADLAGDKLSLSISPAISIDAHHAGKRHAAGVYMEIAARYSEKLPEAIITQHSNVGECRAGGDRLLGHYPLMPLAFNRLCPGFQRLFLSGIEGER